MEDGRVNLGGWWALLTIKQREAQQQAEWRAFQAEVAAERRHREKLAKRVRDHHQEGLVPDRPYTGPTVRVESLDVRDFGAITLPGDEDRLREVLNPPNLLVVGGDLQAGWAASVALQDVLGGRLVVFDLAGAPDPNASNYYETGIPDLGSAIFNARTKERLEGEDVLFLPSIDAAGAVNVDEIRWLLDVQPVAPWVERERMRVLQQYETDQAARIIAHDLGEVEGGEYDVFRPWGGIEAGSAVSFADPFFLVAHSSSGRIPAPLASGTVTWGGLLTVPADTKICPQCAEEVKAAALICRFCRYEFGSLPAAGQTGL